MTGGSPAATMAGKVMSVAPPASALMAPPSVPAPASSAAMLQSMRASCSNNVLVHLMDLNMSCEIYYCLLSARV